MMNPKKKNKPEDVWKHIDIKSPDECWEWVGTKDKNGYGKVTIRPKTFRSHRLIYELTYCPIPTRQCVLHQCDNPSCCNPKHLFLGTPKDNSQDMVHKNRQAGGEDNGNCKLTMDQIKEIRNLYSTKKYSHRQLSKIYNVGHTQIGRIVRKENWRK